MGSLENKLLKHPVINAIISNEPIKGTKPEGYESLCRAYQDYLAEPNEVSYALFIAFAYYWAYVNKNANYEYLIGIRNFLMDIFGEDYVKNPRNIIANYIKIRRINAVNEFISSLNWSSKENLIIYACVSQPVLPVGIALKTLNQLMEENKITKVSLFTGEGLTPISLNNFDYFIKQVGKADYRHKFNFPLVLSRLINFALEANFNHIVMITSGNRGIKDLNERELQVLKNRVKILNEFRHIVISDRVGLSPLNEYVLKALKI